MLRLSGTSPTNPQNSVRPELSPSASSVLQGFLRRDELAKHLGLSPRTIDRWQALRDAPPRIHVGRTVLYRIEAVREWLQSKEHQASTGGRTGVRSAKARPFGRDIGKRTTL
jgi:predicted DNA-binding transcriptional regulator AlpA